MSTCIEEIFSMFSKAYFYNIGTFIYSKLCKNIFQVQYAGTIYINNITGPYISIFIVFILLSCVYINMYTYSPIQLVGPIYILSPWVWSFDLQFTILSPWNSYYWRIINFMKFYYQFCCMRYSTKNVYMYRGKFYKVLHRLCFKY